MGVREWWNGRLGREHEKLIVQCRTKAEGLLTVMEAANAISPNPEIAISIVQLKNMRIDLGLMNAKLHTEGKLSPTSAETVLALLRQLCAAEQEFSKAYTSKP